MYTADILKQELKAAAGEQMLDLRIDNVLLVNVFTNEIYPASIGIYNQKIVSVNSSRTREAREVIDAKGAYAVPGFIDGHIHIETTLLTPEALGEVIIPWGTTTLCIDAMEIANVAGIDGLLAMVKDSEKLPFRLYMEIPSRVPTAPGLETTGGVLGVEEVTQLLKLDASVSLGELDPSKVLGMKEEYLEKILASLGQRKICNGHAIGLETDDLNIYGAGHLSDDHESVYYEELLDRLRLGIMPLVREGSSERNVERLMKGVIEHHLPTENIMFCTDDKHVNDIYEEGHISFNIQKTIDLGMDPVEAIKIATINAAKHFRLEDKIGCIAPGRYADIVLLKDLHKIKPWMVIKDGRVVADENGARPCPQKAYPEKLLDTVHISPAFSAADFRLKAEGKRAKCRIISMIPDQIINDEIQEWMEVDHGEIHADVSRDILKLSVVERYGKNGRVSTALVKGFGLKSGALASSVSHDHHNIVVVGTNDEDMAVAVKELQRLHGGFASAKDGQVVDSLALPLGGLMSLLPASEVMERMNEMNAAVEKMGCPMKAPFMSLSFISLPTVPQLGLTDYGLIDVLGHKIIDLVIETE
ncbi:MAG TPA: adenine deaminase [Candidatus Onthocola gallistercoris]|uniref:Adenine deaminase n=1 Tax=Candidatus Onthocola gallistercoris TaxID=2840876 RepID=A0A9D1HH72_9FIRM|nr:adenine deaminase [Candidatus Onthocola gallistercoris]